MVGGGLGACPHWPQGEQSSSSIPTLGPLQEAAEVASLPSLSPSLPAGTCQQQLDPFPHSPPGQAAACCVGPGVASGRETPEPFLCGLPSQAALLAGLRGCVGKGSGLGVPTATLARQQHAVELGLLQGQRAQTSSSTAPSQAAAYYAAGTAEGREALGPFSHSPSNQAAVHCEAKVTARTETLLLLPPPPASCGSQLAGGRVGIRGCLSSTQAGQKNSA